MKQYLKLGLGAFIVYFFSWYFAFITGINKLAIQSEDTLPAIFLPVTLVEQKSVYVNSYYDMLVAQYPHPDDKDQEKGLTPFYLKKIGENYISAFPLVPALFGVPIYLVFSIFLADITWTNLAVFSHITSAFIMSIAGVSFFHLVSNKFKVNRPGLLTTVYLFGTINYALISQAIWQQGPLQIFTIWMLYFLLSKKYFYSGLFFGLAILSRPTALIWGPFLFLLFISQMEGLSSKEVLKNFVSLAIGLIINILIFAVYTRAFYMDVSNNGYVAQAGVGWLSKFPEGFLGLWISPSKGILVYSPVLIFSLVGLALILKNNNWRKVDNLKYVIFGSIILVHTLVLGIWKHWYGGWSFGYRMASDVIPFLVLCLIPFLESSIYGKYKKVFLGLLLLSILIQIYGIIFFDGIWHAAYDDGFRDTSWLWSLKDSEVAFNIRRILVKFGYLNQACPVCLPD